MSTRRRLVAASSPRVASRLAGPERSVPILHRGADAVYVDLGGDVIGVLSASARALPCGLRTAEAHLPADVASARHAAVGAGGLALGDTVVVPTRRSDPGVPRWRHRDHTGARLDLAAALERGAGSARLAGVAAELPHDALERLAAGDPAGVLPVLGLGSGLTPVGDDVLCGLLATLAGADRLPPELAAETARLAPGRTTALSATLLACAALGEVLPEFRRLLVDLDSPDLDSPGPGSAAAPAAERLAGDVDDLLRVGHTSGAGLLLGATLALRHLASRSPTG